MLLDSFFERKRDLSFTRESNEILNNCEYILLTGDDSDSVGNVRPGKATLTTPPAKEKRKNFFKKPVNTFGGSYCHIYLRTMHILLLFELLHLDKMYAHWRDVQRCIMRNNEYHSVMLENLKIRQL